jgi:hypothetical protein
MMLQVLVHGRPLSISSLKATAPAIFSVLFGGQAQGTAFADVLVGNYNPGGRLPMTWPQDVGQLPCFYNYKVSYVSTKNVHNNVILFNPALCPSRVCERKQRATMAIWVWS